MRAPPGLSTCLTICPSKGRSRETMVPAHLGSSAKNLQSDQRPSCADRVLPMCQVHHVHAYEQRYAPTSSGRRRRVTIVSITARVPSLRGRYSARPDRRARHRPAYPPTHPSHAHPAPATARSSCHLAHHSPMCCRCGAGDRKTTTADREAGLGARCRAQPGPTRPRPGAWQPSGASRRLGARWRRWNTDRDLLGADFRGSVWCQSG